MSFTQHNFLVLALVVSSLLGLAGFNRFMDPYALYDGPHIVGVNGDRPGQELRTRASRAEQIRRLRPAAIALGSSRTEFGIDPEHPGWGVEPVYNCGMGFARVYEMYRYLQHAHAVRAQEKVVVMLDMIQFEDEKHRPSFSEARLAVDVNGQPQAHCLPDERRALLTLDATWASVKLWLGQGQQHHITQANGMLSPQYYLSHFRKKGGHHKAFEATKQAYKDGTYQKLADHGIPEMNWHYFRELLRFAYRERIDLRLGISPHHVVLFEGMQAAGLIPLYESWKINLVKNLNEVAAEFNETPYPLWDFSGDYAYNTEAVPSVDQADTPMRYHWEQTHYKKQLGDLLLTAIFEDDMRNDARAVFASYPLTQPQPGRQFGKRLDLEK